MGEDMPIGLGGNFEYRGTRRGMKSEEVEGTDESGEGSDQVEHVGTSIAVPRSKRGAKSSSEPEMEKGWSANGHPSNMTQQKLE
ncbi:unnamed protein product [Prunus armeniaca]